MNGMLSLVCKYLSDKNKDHSRLQDLFLAKTLKCKEE